MTAKLEEKEKERLIAKIYDIAMEGVKIKNPMLQLQQQMKQYGKFVEGIWESGRKVGFEQGKKSWVNKDQN